LEKSAIDSQILLKGKILLITGGTGSFGNAVLNRFLNTINFVKFESGDLFVNKAPAGTIGDLAQALKIRFYPQLCGYFFSHEFHELALIKLF